ncbi:MAG TPA: hypothetical protein VJ898_05590 [Natrialbaceae archaeon]|nr:hypothetical protein [Natrialbaceae archaeon]
MDDRRAPDRDPTSRRRPVGRRSLLGAVGGLAIAALAGCTTTEKPKGTLIEGDGTAGGDVGDGGATIVPGTPTPKDVFSLSDSSFGPNDDGYMTYAATVENTSDERWIATLHARLRLDDPVTPESDEGSATVTPLTPVDADLTRRIDLGPGETREVSMSFEVTETAYLERYRSASFGISWSDLSKP